MLREIHQLTAILQAEVEGRDIDRERARRLAQILATQFPECAMTMRRVVARMSDDTGMDPSPRLAGDVQPDRSWARC